MDAVKQAVIVICGIKNSGKTTLIRNLIPKLNALGYKVATIKHDGHEFESDVPGTDSYYHQHNEPASNPQGRFLIVTDIKDYQGTEHFVAFEETDKIVGAMVEQLERM